MVNNYNYIKEKFPNSLNTVKQLSRYLDNININLSNGLTESELEQVFVSVVDDYLKYKINPDSLSELCEKLYLLSEDFENLKNSRITISLIQIADLEVYLREEFSGVGNILKETISRYKEIKNRNTTS
jgi:hypothetical protein